MAGGAIPLLLLPGLTNDARVWTGVMRALGRAAECSVASLTSAETMQALAANVLANAPERFALAGLSMGGYCAFEVHRQAPGRVLAIALVDTSARPDTAESRANREKQIERAKTDYAGLVAELVPKWVHASRADDPDVGGVVRAMALEAGAQTFARQQRAIMSRSDSRPSLASITVPTLVVAGRDDALMPREIHEELAGGIAGARLVLLDACGHLAPLERPDGVASAMRQWLRDVG